MMEAIQGVVTFFLSLFSAGSIATAQISSSDELPIAHLVPGGVAVVSAGYGLQPPKVTFDGQPVMVIRPDQQMPWQAIVGIPLKQPVGNASIQIDNKTVTFAVRDKAYPEQHLTVQKKHVNPDQKQLDRIYGEFAEMGRVYKSFTPAQPWHPMAWPAKGPLSSAFGLKRFFNGEQRNPHSGLDIAAPRGTPILAPADGKVVLTGDFFFNGNSVFIDHGQGLISMFCHMDAIEVKEGETINAGDRLGVVGSTGRATGPHLHWTVSLNNARINPMLMMSPLQFSASLSDSHGKPVKVSDGE